jgi:DNA-binding response OmpR family regulator
VSAILGRSLPSAATGVAPVILYVDDEEAIRDLCGDILLRAGYSVDVAGDGQAGWEALQRKKYDLLITDHDMPQVTGLELAVRARDAGLALPIVIASGRASFADDAYAWLRLSSALRKPFTPEALLRTVDAVLCAVPMAAH